MEYLMYYLVYGLLYLLSLMPLWLLYGISNAIYGLIYYVFGYRKKVVMDNLRHAFPEKTEGELVSIAKKFYLNFVDSFMETLKLFSAGPEMIKRRMQFDNPEIFEQFYSQNRSCQVHLGHNFNWELGNLAVPLVIQYKFLVVYMPLANKTFDQIFKNFRTRTGTILISATEMSRSMIPYRHSKYLLCLAADQAPGSPARAYWLNFFGRPTPMVKGPERAAKLGDIPAVFGKIYKTKRGYYHAKFELISDHPSSLQEGELTRRYVKLLEDAIRKDPDMWLWSHRRWKHPWKEEYKASWIDEGPLPDSKAQ